MAGANRSAIAGWSVAGLLGLMLLGQGSPGANGAGDHESQYVTARTLRCRASPDEAGERVQSFMRGEQVTVTERNGDWSKIGGAVDCWVASRYLADARPAPEPEPQPAPATSSQRMGLLSSRTYAEPSRTYSEPRIEPRREAPRRETAEYQSYSRPQRAFSGAFRNCSEARAAGAVPVRAGDPGYSRRLDRDGDGVGCE